MRKKIIPLIGMIGALFIVLILTFPMLTMNQKDIPIGIVNLDNGVNTPKGSVNAGTTFTKKMLSTKNKVLNFKEEKNENKLRSKLDDNKYYAIIIIPKDFTQKAMNNDAKVDIIVNEGSNPMIAMQLKPILTAMGSKSNINFNIKSINEISSYGFKAMLIPMMLILMTFITSLITSLLITFNIKDKKNNKELIKQYSYIIIMSLIIGFSITSLVILLSGIDINIIKPAFFITIVSFSLMTFIHGSLRLFGKKGLLLPIILFILGMGLIQIPYEYLVHGWQILIASWEPFRYIGIGLREVLYQNHGIINNSFICLLVLVIIGISFTIVSVFKNNNIKFHA